ncbi:MAG: hypothetical protein SFU98_13535, partial [Leptospiraceae bacterium]|nr:hypothetical protein [Leptospiraceae bacterium]
MASKNFLNKIPQNLKDKVNNDFKGFEAQKDVFYNTAELIFEIENIDSFIELINDSNFYSYLNKRKTISPTRFGEQLQRIFRRVIEEIPIGLVGLVALEMASPEYIKTERIFFLKKDDHSLLVEFEINFRRVIEQIPSLKNDYLNLVTEIHFLECVSLEKEVSKFIFEKITDYLISCRNYKLTLKLCINLLRPFVQRFILISIDHGIWKKYIQSILVILTNPSYVDNYLRTLEIYSNRFSTKNKKLTNDKKLLEESNDLTPFLVSLSKEEEFKTWKEFLKLYGDHKNDFEYFVWNEIFRLPINKNYIAMEILVSTPFAKMRSYYSANTGVLKFLIRNIITSLEELKMRNIPASSYKLILKLFLNLKVNREYLKRRAFFFHILKEFTNSKYIELELLRFIFFEYIFIATGIVPNYHIKMEKFCDDSHRVFCDWVDLSYSRALILKPNERLQFFLPVFEYFRNVIWFNATEKFSKFEYRFKQYQSAILSVNREDEAIDELEKVTSDEFIQYTDSFFEVFYSKSELIHLAIKSDYWYRLTLENSRPYIQSVLLNLIGTINLVAGQSGAYTDGKTIYLPEYINSFKDNLFPIENNRNLTLYIGLALHECGHILGGSFRFNLIYYMRTLEKPNLFKHIMNIFEDHRIESFIIQMNVYPQTKDIITTLNEFLTVNNWKQESPIYQEFLLHCFDEANDYETVLTRFSNYTEKRNKLLNLKVNTGRFSNLILLKEYIVNRLKNMKISNPFGAYEISREVYEIVKHWLLEDLADIEDPKGIHSYREELATENDELQPRTILTEEELRELYNSYNQNPRLFVQENFLPDVPQMHAGANEKIESKGISEIILDDSIEKRYQEAGTIDLSHRTRVDDLSAENQITSSYESETLTRKKLKIKKKKSKVVYSIDPKTNSRTKLNEIKEYLISGIDNNFIKKMRKWDFLRKRILKELSSLEIQNKETHDLSSIEGEINMEALLEIISSPNKVGVFDYLDNYTEYYKSLDVVIGIDASGSTSMNTNSEYTIIEIEKAFAMIFGEALSTFTNRISYLAFDSMSSTNIYRAATIRNVSAIKSGNGNRDGDFIRFVNDELKKSTSDLKYFFFLSDGQPNSDNYNGKEALDDTLIALREAKNSGIRVIYFNIDIAK